MIRFTALALLLQCLAAHASYHYPDPRLTITLPGAPPIAYSYNEEGLRDSQSQNGQTLHYLYDQTSLIAETNTTGDELARYTHSSVGLIAEARSGVQTYLHTDALSTPIAVTDIAGGVTTRYTWDSWGNLQQQTGVSQQPFGFTGYQRDEQTGLHYAQQRYYDSEIGRFNRHDPFRGDIDTPLSLHRYLYANANPTIFVDPTGEVGFFSPVDAFVDDTVANYDRQIEAAIADEARGRALTLGIGRGLAGLGGVAVGSLNATSNLLAIGLGVEVEQATTELNQTQLALSDGIEVMDKTAKFIRDNPAQAGAAVVVEGVEFSKAVMRGDAEALAALGRGLGEGAIPFGLAVKPVQTTAKATAAAARHAASESGNVVRSAARAIRTEADNIASVLRADGEFGRIDLSADLDRLSAFDRSSTRQRVLSRLEESRAARPTDAGPRFIEAEKQIEIRASLESPNILFRGQNNSVSPMRILEDGFFSKGNSDDLLLHAIDSNNPPSLFVATTPSFFIASEFATRNITRSGSVFAIRRSRGLDVNARLGEISPSRREREVAVPILVPASDILGFTPLRSDGSFGNASIINLNYRK